eukprot:5265800-Pyramimonas_sp.AAC.1
MISLNTLQTAGCAAPVARGAWPSAHQDCPTLTSAAPTKRESAEEEFARRAHSAPLVRLTERTLNPKPQPVVSPRSVPSLGAANHVTLRLRRLLGSSGN